MRVNECQNHDNNVQVYNNFDKQSHVIYTCAPCIAWITRGKYDTLLRYEINAGWSFFFYHTCATTWVFLFSFSLFEIQTLCIPIYLSHSSTLNVGVVVVGVGGELCLLTRWFKDVSCTLSRLPRNALLWLANFSLFMGEPKITSHSHDAGPHINHNRVLYNWKSFHSEGD